MSDYGQTFFALTQGYIALLVRLVSVTENEMRHITLLSLSVFMFNILPTSSYFHFPATAFEL